MFRKTLILFTFYIFNGYIRFIHSECPPGFILKPCVCKPSIPSYSYFLFDEDNAEPKTTQKPSIVCENIHNASFDIQAIFSKFSAFNSAISNQNVTSFDSFLLHNTTIRHLPDNVFINITFKNLLFQDNFQLTTIHKNAFFNFKNDVELFQTVNTNLSDTDTIFSIIGQFQNLRRLSMHNDRLKYIPSYAFNHKNLTHIWFGLEYPRKSQPIEHIGKYAFYNVPNLQFLRIFSPKLTKINKYAFAQRNRYTSSTGISNMLEIYLGGENLVSTSFEPTSFNRFRNRFVFVRFYYTSITYLDENIFQPFLESNPSSLIDISSSNTMFECDCRSGWIQNDYFKNVDRLDNRVYGYRCWAYDFTKDCTVNQ